MPTCAQHRYHILDAVDMPREQQSELTSKYVPYESPLRKDELVEIVMRVWEVTDATMPDGGREAFEDHTMTGIRGSIANALDFDYYEQVDETDDGRPIVERNHADEFLEAELRKVREPLHWPERWVEGEYVGIVPANVEKTTNGPARVTVTVDDEELFKEEIALGEELDIDVEFDRLGGGDDAE